MAGIGTVSLSGKIQKYLNDELNGDNVESICQLLKSTKGLGYRRRIIEDIGRRPLKLFDEMMRRGDIKETEYSLLLKILDEADLPDCVQYIQEIIDEHTQKNIPAGTQFARPNDLYVTSSLKCPAQPSSPLLSPGFPSQSDNCSSKRSRYAAFGHRSSEDSVFPDNGNYSRTYYLRGDSDYYTFQENRKGLVAIINNFTNRDRDGVRFRMGTIEDQKDIEQFFKSGRFADLYKVDEPKLNLNHEAFEQFLNSLATKLRDNKDQYNSFFLFVLSHGELDGVQTYYTGDQTPQVMPIEKITKKFNECLPGCPKIFVIQACQGRYDNQIQDVEPDAITPCPGGNQPDDSEDVDGDEVTLDTGPPNAADILTAFATVKGYKSYRVKDGLGSWFIQKLLTELGEAHKECYYSSHILDLLTKVQETVSKKKGKATPDGGEPGRKVLVKQMPCFQSSLRKKFYLLPPVLPE